MLRRTHNLATRGAFRASALLLLSAEGLKRAADTRRHLNALWANASGLSQSQRAAEVRAAMDTAALSVDTPREEDVTRALGEGFDRLLLMLVPLEPESQPYLERALSLAGRAGIELSLRTVQHLFARVASYSQAIQVFHTMRQCRVAMRVEAYHAMLFCLQRLEEESWCRRFNDDLRRTNNAVTSQALDFVVNGCENQLIPESKPWIGRVMFADTELGAKGTSDAEFDAMGAMWTQRFRDGVPVLAPEASAPAAAKAPKAKNAAA